jgi:cysteine-rich repeat protein
MRRSTAFASLAAALLLAAPAGADDVKCISALNTNAANVVKVFSKHLRGCVEAADKAGALTAAACAAVDPGNKIANAAQKAVEQDVGGAKDKCENTAPAFAYTGAGNATEFAGISAVGLSRNLFGSDLDESVVTDGSKAKKACRDAVYKDAAALLDANLAQFNACKKAALKSGVSSDEQLAAACLPKSVLADPKQKLAPKRAKLVKDVEKKCTGLLSTELFPGDCAKDSALASCVERAAQCRACTAIARIDGLAPECDLYDNGTADDSCAVCGDSAIEGAETCDDGNTHDGDGCSSTCQFSSALVFSNPCNGGSTRADDALATFGGPVHLVVDDFTAFNTAFDAGGFDLVVFDSFCDAIEDSASARLQTWAAGGGRLLIAYWGLHSDNSLEAALGVSSVVYYDDFRDVFADPASPTNFFTLDHTFPSPLTGSDPGDDYAIGQELTLTGAGFLAARLDSTSGPGAIAVTNSGRTVVLGFTPELSGTNDSGPIVDADLDGVGDMQELWENVIRYVYGL